MDDDPEPGLLLGSHEASEQLLSPRGLQKGNPESNDDGNIPQEGGDSGPFMEQEATKKPIVGKDVPEQTLRTESRTSIFQSKELREQSQTPNVSSSIKSSTTSLRKTSRRSIQRVPGQDTRQLPPLSQKSSRTLSINETETKDVTWVSTRTGKIMKCRSQQTSLIWERKVLSEILHPSSEDSERSKGEETDMTNTEEEVTSSGETTAPEEAVGPEVRRGSHPREEKASKRGGQQQESRRSSQRSMNEPILLIQKGLDAEEDLPWISQRTGKEMRNKAQQTSVIWELKTLSEILRSSSQESFGNMETDTTEVDDSGDTEVEQAVVQESRHSIPQDAVDQTSRRSSKQLDARSSQPEIQPREEEKTESRQKGQVPKADQAQQTDSTESFKRKLLDYSQQTDDAGIQPTVDQKGSSIGIQKTEGDRSRMGSPELQRRESQPIDLASPEQSQPSLRPGSKTGVEVESEVTAGPQGEQTEFAQEPPFPQKVQEKQDGGSVPEDTWVSRRTGKVVRNQIQQTDKSWLQYCAAKMRKVRKSSSQQTDESFLQRYLAMKGENREPPAGSDLPARDGVSGRLCDDGSATGFQLTDVPLSPEGSESDAAVAGMAEEVELPACRAEERGEGQWPEEDAVVGGPTSNEVQSPGESESKSTVESTSCYVEGEDAAQQTYSVISLEDGIWMNRRTGKILVSHTQQTSQVVLPTAQSATVRRKVGGGEEEEAFRLAEKELSEASADAEAPELEETQPVTGSPGEPPGGASQPDDEAENVLSVRLSEAMLLSVSYPDVEDENELLYSPIEDGSWVNLKTGRLLASQEQQTEGGSDPFPEAEKSQEASWRPSEEDLSSALLQLSGGEGMDDDPVSKIQEPL
ncbi:uncharacterized protein LOC144586329 [Pogona vitticeps]